MLGKTVTDCYGDALDRTVEALLQLPGEDGWDDTARRWREAWERVVATFDEVGSGAATDVETTHAVGSALRFLAEPPWGASAAPCYRPPVRARCEALSRHSAEVARFHRDQMRRMYEGVLAAAMDGSRAHRAQRHALELAIKGLQGLARDPDLPAQDKHKVLHALARGHLYRSAIIRPRGFTTPAKKIEALRSALRALEEVGTPDRESRRLKAIVGLEMKRASGTEEEDLAKWLGHAKADLVAPLDSPDDVRIALAYAQNTKDLSVLAALDLASDAVVTPLERLRAECIRFGAGQADRVGAYVESALEWVGERYLSDPAWEELVEAIQFLGREKPPHTLWRQLAISAWETCRDAEALVVDNCHLRWYWSRQRDLYDLAFHAADTAAMKAEIADSLKGRPTMRWSGVEKMATGRHAARLRERIEAEAAALSGRYVKNLVPGRGRQRQAANPSRPVTDLPSSWIAVHFYLSSGALRAEDRDHGYALIYDAESKQWAEFTFPSRPLWEAFWTWQDDYARNKERAAPALKMLCREIGVSLARLFQIPANRPVAFIPHGFLHRVPIHMAIRSDDDVDWVWAEEHPSTSLASWAVSHPDQPSASLAAGGRVLIHHFSPPYASLLACSDWANRDEESGDSKTLFSLAKAPELLVILCHGKGSTVHPFSGRLKLKDQDVTLADLLEANIPLTDSRVVLGACETDMAPPLGTAVDEHVTLSSVLQQSGAAEVVSGMWEVENTRIAEIVELARTRRPETSLLELLWWWQRDSLANCYHANEGDARELYAIAAFRVAGIQYKGIRQGAPC